MDKNIERHQVNQYVIKTCSSNKKWYILHYAADSDHHYNEHANNHYPREEELTDMEQKDILQSANNIIYKFIFAMKKTKT